MTILLLLFLLAAACWGLLFWRLQLARRLLDEQSQLLTRQREALDRADSLIQSLDQQLQGVIEQLAAQGDPAARAYLEHLAAQRRVH